MKKIRLNSKDIGKMLGLELKKKDQVELVEDELKIIIINKIPSFFYYNDQPVPTLRFLQQNDFLKKITVDMGAVKFIVNGADVMRPGIVEIEPGIEKEDFVIVVDVNHKKPLAVGIPLFNSAEMQRQTVGKCVKSIHYVGDEIWKK